MDVNGVCVVMVPDKVGDYAQNRVHPGFVSKESRVS